jgi:predicted helicase
MALKLLSNSFLTGLIENAARSEFIYYSDFLRRPHKDIMQHLLQDNLVLMASRQQTETGFHHIFLTNILADCNALSLSSRERNYYFPLYLYPDANHPQKSLFARQHCPNFSQGFLDAITIKIGYTPIPEMIFYYIYAILHSPTYRTRYAEFLKIDFPRFPLTSDDILFRQLSAYGEELVALHLMKSPRLDALATTFVDAGSDLTVDPGHPKYDENSSSVLINKKGDKFTEVPKAV